jgi:predicted ribosome quality control (RQC) complex YloA/Tae2 family protein
LESTLKNAVVSECFSQSKDELILRFEAAGGSFLIKASLLPGFSCLSFPDNFQRARKNSVDLFPQLIGTRVRGVRQFNNERSFSIQFTDDIDLLFKMHGNRTNILLFQGGSPTELFRNNLIADRELKLETLDREIDWGYENFERHAANLKPIYFTFGKIVWHYLEENGFETKSLETRWQMITQVIKDLSFPRYYIITLEAKPALSLLPTGEIKKMWDEPLPAANDFYYSFTHLFAFSKEQAELLTFLKARIDAGNHYCEKNFTRLAQLERDNNYKVWADLVMANLNNIEPRSEKVILENFYNDYKPAEIKLKKDLSPQKNAELFYKKAKNQHIEIARLKDAISTKQAEVDNVQMKFKLVESVADLKALRALRSELNPEKESKKQKVPLPYHEFHYSGFNIWVGKNAQSNDVLTLQYGYKEDLWLHAKDVAGSHVLIKHQSGKNFPKDVIAYAASLAAYNSKRKNESLCPVIVTPKKFVRKRKGDPPGAVMVDREDVIMVEPRKG